MQGHIYIYGEIISDQSEGVSDYGYVNPKSVLDQLKANEGATRLLVHINSPGGSVDAGFAIYDILKTSKKRVDTLIEGQCYSIATVIAMAGKKREATQNSSFLVHFPSTQAKGNAENFEKLARQLRQLEEKAANFYASTANISYDDAMTEMAKDDFMSLEKALEYGFITGIVETAKAVARFDEPKPNTMNEKEQKGFFKQLAEAFKMVDKEDPKNIMLKTATGEDVEFEREQGAIQSGDKATIGGKPADGEVLMANGDTILFEKGEVKTVKEKEVETLDEVVAKALKPITEQLEGIQNKLAERENEIGELKAEMSKRDTVFNSLKSIVSENSVDQKENPKRKNEHAKEANPLSMAK